MLNLLALLDFIQSYSVPLIGSANEIISYDCFLQSGSPLLPSVTSTRCRVVQILMVHWCFSSTENQITLSNLRKTVTHLKLKGDRDTDY